MPLHPASKLVLLALAGAVMVTGCGGSVPKDAAASYPAGAAGIDEAMADLERGEAAITERFGAIASGAPELGAAPAAPATPYAQPPPAQPPLPQAPQGDVPSAAPPPAEPSPAQAEARAAEEDHAEEAEQSAERDDAARCDMACHALGSMRRAAEHVCRAAGPLDARCGRARERVGHAERKVKDACETCDG